MEAPKMLSETQFNEILTMIPNSRDRANLVVHHVLTQHKIKELEEERRTILHKIGMLESALDSIHDDLRRAGDQIAEQASMIDSMAEAAEAADTRQEAARTGEVAVAMTEEQTKQALDDFRAKIVHWLRTGPGAGETVRAKFAFKLAGLIESGAYAANSEYAAY